MIATVFLAACQQQGSGSPSSSDKSFWIPQQAKEPSVGSEFQKFSTEDSMLDLPVSARFQPLVPRRRKTDKLYFENVPLPYGNLLAFYALDPTQTYPSKPSRARMAKLVENMGYRGAKNMVAQNSVQRMGQTSYTEFRSDEKSCVGTYKGLGSTFNMGGQTVHRGAVISVNCFPAGSEPDTRPFVRTVNEVRLKQ